MKPIITKITIPLLIPEKETGYIFSPSRVEIAIQDEGAGPYLCIEGINDEPELNAGENAHQFYLQTIAEIDQFAAICKKMLKGDFK